MAPGFGTASVALHATPTILATFFAHFATWPSRHHHQSQSADSAEPQQGPTSLDTLPNNQLRYDEGLRVVRKFLQYASRHGVEEVQTFTAQPIPVPAWVRRDVVLVPKECIEAAAKILTEHLKSYAPDGKGLELVGGEKWWQVRGRALEGEWIEMAKDYARRKAAKKAAAADKKAKTRSWRQSTFGSWTFPAKRVHDASGGAVKGDRVLLYIHGGAFFFSSLDLHRYQIQRHARKAGARAFVPNYRLSPQYPFPCGLLDSLAAYLYLIDPPSGHHKFDPSEVILMGDSAGGGMVLSMLVLIREMGLPMPAAASLMSPWSDLTHSMPSIMGWDGGDYIPNVGFHYRPSVAWPPLPGDGVVVEGHGIVEDQIQLYCPNSLLTHPLVSIINNGSLGGLCPLYISAGGAELLRDEIIYVAFKAADPPAFPPSQATLEEYPNEVPLIDKYPPTRVHLQIFEGCAHVTTTLAWTRSAKHIFRGTANFNIWAFNAAAKQRDVKRSQSTPHVPRALAIDTGVASLPTSFPSSPAESDHGLAGLTIHGSTMASHSADTSAVPSAAASSVFLPGSTTTSAMPSPEITDAEDSDTEGDANAPAEPGSYRIGVTGIEPLFNDGQTIVAERVSTHGRVTPMEPASAVPALDPALRPQIGRVRADGPLGKWIAKRKDWDQRFSKQLAHWQEIRRKDREQAEKSGFLTGTLQGEHPPLSSIVGMHDSQLAADVARSVDAPTQSKMNPAVALWMKVSDKDDVEDQAKERARRERAGHHSQSASTSEAKAQTGGGEEKTA